MIMKRIPILLLLTTLLTTASTADAQENTAYENRVDVEVSEPRLTPRAEPLRDFPVEQVLDVTDFGAVPDDDGNDVAGIRAAMKRATQAKVPTEVRFPKGRYYLDADIETDEYAKVTNDALAMAKAEQVILNGNGSEIIIRTPPTGFLALTRARTSSCATSWSIGTRRRLPRGLCATSIARRERSTFEVEPGFVSMDHPLWQRPNRKGYDSIRWGMLKDPEIPGRMKRDVPNVYFCDEWEKLAERTFRMKLRNRGQAVHFEVGDRYVHVDRNGGGLILCPSCERVTFQRITNYTSPGLDYGGGGTKELAVLDCKVLIKPGRWHTSNADGLHFPVSRPGPWIEGCTLRGHGRRRGQLLLQGRFLHRDPLRHRVRADRPCPDGGRLPCVRIRSEAGPEAGRAEGRVGRAERAPPAGEARHADPRRQNRHGDRRPTRSSSTIDSTGGFVFRNNTFRNIRRFGILIDSRDGLIENNRFEATSSNGVVIHNDPDWPEGFATGNVIIRGNTFDTCNVERIYRADTSASISIKTNRLGWQPAPYRGIADILIEDNTFVNWRNQAMSIGCAENAIVRNNRLVADADGPAGVDGRPHVPIRVFNATRVSVRGNHIEDGRELIPGAIEVADDCEAVDASR